MGARLLKIDPIIVHLVTIHGDGWADVAQESGPDSNLRSRALASMAQIMDLDLRNESEREQAEKAFEQNKECL